MSKVIVITKGSVTPKDIREMRKAGHVVVEARAIEDVKIMDNYTQLKGDIILHCALTALTYGNDGTCRIAFSNLVNEKLRKLIIPTT